MPTMTSAQIHAATGREPTSNPGAATGYVVIPSAGSCTWHLNPACGALRGRRRTAFEEPSLAELADEQRRWDRKPCRRCTTAALWDDLAASATNPGYHYLSCDDYHLNRYCGTCATLSRYAATRDVLTTAADGRVLILAVGTR